MFQLNVKTVLQSIQIVSILSSNYLLKLNILKTNVVYVDKDIIEDSASTDLSDDIPGTSSMINVEVHHSC